jgi:hypothetical protein
MKTFKFIQQTKRSNPEEHWYFTEENGAYVSDSGSFDKEIAYGKFQILCNGGSLEPKKEVLEEVIYEPKP